MFGLLAVFAWWTTSVHAKEEEEEEEEADPKTVAGAVMIILTLMVLFSVLFETAQHHLKSHVQSNSPQLMPVLDSLFQELTLLGFIGLSLFIFDKLEVVHEMSQSLFHEEGEVGELCESVHMALFLVMVLFLATVIYLVRTGGQIQEEWESWEENILDTSELREGLSQLYSRPKTCATLLQYNEPIEYQKACYASLRSKFMGSGIPEPFSFADYLNRRLGFHLGEVVEVPVDTWLGLWFIMLAAWMAHDNLSPEIEFMILLTVAYSLPILMRIIHGKLRNIKYQATPMTLIRESQRLHQAKTGEKSGLLSAGVEMGQVTSASDPLALEQRYGAHESDTNEESEHHERFWNGAKLEKEAPDFTLSLIRYCLLINSIYIALCALMVFPALFKDMSGNPDGPHMAFGLVLVCIVPPVVLLLLTPHVIKEFTLVSNIENMQNQRVIEQCKSRMRTRSAFLTLKVIYMMISGLGVLQPAHGEGHKHKHNGKKKKPADNATRALNRRRVWKEIFDTFDDDKGGHLTGKELHDLLRNIAGENVITEAKINAIVKELDSNNDNEIDFDEFYNYVNGIMENETQDPREISDGIFKLCDQDPTHEEEAKEGHEHGEGNGFLRCLTSICEKEEEEEEGPDITIKELQDILKKTGQELQADEVFDVISDIDEDGDGKLNEGEFFLLLQRLEVI